MRYWDRFKWCLVGGLGYATVWLLFKLLEAFIV